MLKAHLHILKVFSFVALLALQPLWSQGFGPRQLINDEAGYIRMARLADFDNDNDLDIVTAATPAIAWYENLDGMGTFSAPHIIEEGMGQSFALTPAYIDGDEYIDLVVSYLDEDTVGWYRNLGGLGGFGSIQIIATNLFNAGGVEAADLDGDEDNDLVLGVINGTGLYWVENLDGQGTFGPLITIDPSISQARMQGIGDIDGDDDMDILTNSADGIYLSWYENADGQGTFSMRHIIDPIGLYENEIHLVNLDEDEDLDILSEKSDMVVWRKNLDGLGNFSDPINITDDVGIIRVNAADLDNDGDQDILSTSNNDFVAWQENLDGLGNFGSQNIIDNNLILPRTVVAGDLNGDTYRDVVSASLFTTDTQLVWYENRIVLGTTHFAIEELEVFPNPVGEVLSVIAQASIEKVTFYSPLGQRLMEVTQGFGQIPMEHLPSGLLLVEIATAQGKVMQKLVKQ